MTSYKNSFRLSVYVRVTQHIKIRLKFLIGLVQRMLFIAVKSVLIHFTR
jgi:hypothetical protein